ncbi:MAG: YARHG domain-containing protein [Lachnospiraceae bacterium]|nr:YARHG domain-containing protein [Lachnospiraceae bacterium]
MFCAKCGAELNDEDLFCAQCGNAVSKASSEVDSAENRETDTNHEIAENNDKVEKAVDKQETEEKLERTNPESTNSELMPSKKKNIIKWVIFAIVGILVITFIAEEIIVRYRRKIVDFYEIAHTFDEERISKFFAIDEVQSIPGSINVYRLDDHYAYITFYEDPNGWVSVQLQDHGDDYEYTYHKMAGHELFDTPEDFEKDERFTEIVRRGDVVYYDDIDCEDTYLMVFLNEQGKAYNIVYEYNKPNSDNDMDELLVTSIAYPELSEKTVVSDAGKKRAEECGISISDIKKKYEDDNTAEESSLNNDKLDNSENDTSSSPDQAEGIVAGDFVGGNGCSLYVWYGLEGDCIINILKGNTEIGQYYGDGYSGRYVDFDTESSSISVKYENDTITISGYGSAVDGTYSRSSEETSNKEPEYVVVSASDGGANMRSGPGTEYEITMPMVPVGEVLIVMDSANANNGKTWLNVIWKDYEGWVAKSQVSEAFEYIIPYSSAVELDESDLELLTAQELTYARNEIFARHGYVFNSYELNGYFRTKEWYHPDTNYSGILQGVEQENASFISDYQNKYGLTYKPE